MSMLEEFYDICLDNDFDDVVVHDNVIYCNIRSFDHRYRLQAVQKTILLN